MAKFVKTYATNYQVIVFDNRGAGQSDSPNYPYTVEMMADDTIALCKALDINSAHFIGNSMGGAIVQTIAHKFPEMVKSAIISNSFPKANTRLSLQVQVNLALRKANLPLEILIKPVLSTIYSARFLQQDNIVDNLTQLIISKPYPLTIQSYTNQAHALLAFNSNAWLAEIKRPCLIIAADDDFLADVESAKKWHRQFQMPSFSALTKLDIYRTLNKLSSSTN